MLQSVSNSEVTKITNLAALELAYFVNVLVAHRWTNSVVSWASAT